MNKTIVSCFALLMLANLLAGCGPEKPQNEATVTGKVTYNGQPVENATVLFQTDDFSYTAAGGTDAEGVYTLSDGTASGCKPGEYVVTISKTETTSEGEHVSEDDPAYGDPGSTPKVTTTHLLPEKYADPLSTDLKATVQAGENTIDFTLED